MKNKSGSKNNEVFKQSLNILGFQNNKKENVQDQDQVKTQNLSNNIGTCTNSQGIIGNEVAQEFINGVENLELEQILQVFKWMVNTCNLENIQNIITIEKKLPNTNKKKQIKPLLVKFIRTTSYLALGAGIVFFAGNLLLGNGFLPAISVAASGVFQKQKKKFGESILTETPELVTKSFQLIKENISPIPIQQIPFLPSPDKQILKLKDLLIQQAGDYKKD